MMAATQPSLCVEQLEYIRTFTSAIPLSWAASPDFGEAIRRGFYYPCHRAVGFYQNSKWLCLKIFLEGPQTLKDLQIRLGKRRPSEVADMFFKYKLGEARTGAMLDAITKALNCDMFIRAKPVDKLAPDYEMAVSLPPKIFSEDAVFTEEEYRYMLSDRTLYWTWNGERPSFP